MRTTIDGRATMASQAPAASAPVSPALRVATPFAAHVTEEEIAAIVAVFSILTAPAPRPVGHQHGWSSPRLRSPLRPGPGAWRASGLPH